MKGYRIASLATSIITDYNRIMQPVVNLVLDTVSRFRPVALTRRLKKGWIIASKDRIVIAMHDILRSSAETLNLVETILFDKKLCLKVLSLPEDICSVTLEPVYDDTIKSFTSKYSKIIDEYFNDRGLVLLTAIMHPTSPNNIFVVHSDRSTAVRIRSYPLQIYHESKKGTFYIKLYKEGIVRFEIRFKSKTRSSLKLVLNDLALAYAYCKGYMNALNKILSLLEKHIDEKPVYRVVREYMK